MSRPVGDRSVSTIRGVKYSNGLFGNEPLNAFGSVGPSKSGPFNGLDRFRSNFSFTLRTVEEGDNGLFVTRPVLSLLFPPGFQNCHSPVTGR